MNTMLRQCLRACAAMFTLLLLLSSVNAHHGWSSYDQNKTIDVSGPIIESSYGNPHGYIKIKGDGVIWFVVLPPGSQMATRGLTAKMIKPGVQVQIIGHPHKTEKTEMRASKITSFGKTVDLR
jgi:Family of unknown function (DUF6152)